MAFLWKWCHTAMTWVANFQTLLFTFCHFDNKKAFELSHQRAFYIIKSWIFPKSISFAKFMQFCMSMANEMCTLNSFKQKICDNFCNFYYFIELHKWPFASIQARLELTKANWSLCKYLLDSIRRIGSLV